jgi:hypothetical protein
MAERPGHDVLDVEGLDSVDALEPHVLLARRELDLLPQDLRVEEILDANPDPRRLVRIRGADPAPRRSDLQLPETALARAVECDVPRHDQMRVAGDEDEAVGPVPARLELVELRDQHLRVDDASRADRARDSGDDARRDGANLVRLAVDDDRVPGVRAALVATDEVGLLGEQVDDLPLPLVAPLRPDDHGRGHRPILARAPARRTSVTPVLPSAAELDVARPTGARATIRDRARDATPRRPPRDRRTLRSAAGS